MLTFKDEETVRRIIQEEVHAEVKSQLTDFRSEMIDRLDKILKVTSDVQEEMVALSHKSAEHTNVLDDLKSRLNVVENKPKAN